MRLRLILSFIFIVLISITIVSVVARQGTANEVQTFMFRGGASGSTSLVESLEGYYATNGSWVGVESLLPARGGQSGGKGRQEGVAGLQYILADGNGNIVINSANPDASGALSRGEQKSAVPLEVSGDTVGYLFVEGSSIINRDQGQHLINNLNNAALVAALVAGAISLVLALFLASRIMRPVNELTGAAEQLGGGDLSQRVPVRGRDELAVLGNTFNLMADRLQSAEESRRAMTADIAHELRNPLAVQRANLEALQDGIYPLTVENLAPIAEQNALLTRLVEDLRTLAQADAGGLELDLVAVSLADLSNRIVEGYQPAAREKDIHLNFNRPTMSGSDRIEIMADPFRMEQIIGNLLDNALRYTPAAGEIEVTIEERTDMIQLSIHDSGPGIPVEGLPYIFDRFYRADRSRCREDGGTGLGLAIARQLAEAHGGQLSAANHPGGGAIFTLSISNRE